MLHKTGKLYEVTMEGYETIKVVASEATAAIAAVTEYLDEYGAGLALESVRLLDKEIVMAL